MGEWEDFFERAVLNEGASDQALSAGAAALGIELPRDYVRFMRAYDGGEGLVGSNYLVLWRANELHRFNREYEATENVPGLVLFGSDGRGEAYAFDTRTASFPIVMVPFIGMDYGAAIPMASSFSGFLKRLKETP